VVTLVFVLQNTVPVPYWDQFGIGMFLVSTFDRGYPSFAELFSQHNESRKLFPRLLFWLLALPGTWNMRNETVAHVLTIFASASCLTLLLRRHLPPWPAACFSAIGGTLLFSLSQWQNLLWGIQFITSVPTLALLVSIYALYHPRWSLVARTAVATVSSVVATYSYANGMALWVLLLPIFLLAPAGSVRARWTAIGVFVLVGAAALAAYFTGYQRPGGHPPMSAAVYNPVATAEYFVAFLGNGLRFSDHFSIAVRTGTVALILILLGSAILYAAAFLRRDLSILRNASPFLTLAAYAMLSAAVTAAGRIGLGMQTAVSERYVTFALPLFVALLPVMYLAVCQLPGLLSRSAPAVCTFLAGSLLTLHLLAVPLARSQAADFTRERQRALPLAVFFDLIPNGPEAQTLLYPVPNEARKVLIDLARLGKLPFPLAKAELASAYAPQPGFRPGVPMLGKLDSVSRTADRVVLSGWAVSPTDSRKPADAIVLARRLPSGEAKLLAITTRTGELRPDVPQNAGHHYTATAGWTFSLDPTQTPLPPESEWELLVYDAAEHRLVPLR
jgi:hypothetical protein